MFFVQKFFYLQLHNFSRAIICFIHNYHQLFRDLQKKPNESKIPNRPEKSNEVVSLFRPEIQF